MIVYHATPADNVPMIDRDGLVLPPPGRWFQRCDGGLVIERDEPNPIHLSIDVPWDDLVSFCHDVEPDQVAIYRVDVTGLPVSPGWDGEGTLACHYPIPPARLTRVQ